MFFSCSACEPVANVSALQTLMLCECIAVGAYHKIIAMPLGEMHVWRLSKPKLEEK